MPVSVTYNSSAAYDGTSTSSSATSGTVTAVFDDSQISISDEVTFSGFSASQLADAGLSGGSGFYLGSFLFDGYIYQIFGPNNTPTPGVPDLSLNPTVLFVHTGLQATDPIFEASRASFMNNPGSQMLTSDSLTCFAAGTEISTPNGVTPVEALRIGDLVLTAKGDAVPVLWLGRKTAHKAFFGARLQPVRIRAGALGHGLPLRELRVTPDHGLLIDGMIVNASALVGADGIDEVPMAELPLEVTYYHVETEAHDIILANGAPAETFVDAATRASFDNYSDYLSLYGADRIIPESPRPRVTSARLWSARAATAERPALAASGAR